MLSYASCATRPQYLYGGCATRRDDLHGHGSPLTGLALKGCQANVPSIWGTRIAYNLYCETSHGRRQRQDPGRSGRYVKTATGRPRRLVQPRDRGNFEIFEDEAIDLRANRIAAIAVNDSGAVGFSETAAGRGLRVFAAASTDNRRDGRQEHAPGLALGPGGVLWTLKVTTMPHVPDHSVLYRRHAGCTRSELLRGGPGRNVGPNPDGQLAVDSRTVYLLKQGTGILAHHFTPDHGCR